MFSIYNALHEMQLTSINIMAGVSFYCFLLKQQSTTQSSVLYLFITIHDVLCFAEPCIVQL